jgi:DNA-binding IscR family transcriptional regulator
MNHLQDVQYALMCLDELGHHAHRPIAASEVGRRQGVPWPDCLSILRRLGQAGIVAWADRDQVILNRSSEDVTALELLQALWTPEQPRREFRMTWGGRRTARTVLGFIAKISPEIDVEERNN